MEQKRLKVLLGCYACSPNCGSEPGMGWHFTINIARFHDVHVIVEESKFKTKILQFAETHPEIVKNITFHFIPRKRIRILRKVWPPSYYWFYRSWQKKAYQLALKLHEQENFDIVHQITLAGFREPGYLWKLPIPYIWGPIGGFTQTPWKLIPGCGLHGAIYFTARNIINAFQKRFSYAGRQVAQQAHTILVSDKRGLCDVKRHWDKTAELILEVSTNNSLSASHISLRPKNESLKICWVGHLIALKSLELLLFAIHKCRNKDIVLEVLGDGDMAGKWKKLAHSLNIANRVNFKGRVSHDEVMKVMRQCHVFCHTSIKEGGTGTVILEALQNGLPTIILNHGGAAHVVDNSCGIKIPIENRTQISNDIAEQLEILATDESWRQELAKGALARASSFTWKSKMESINEIYKRASITN